MSEEEDGIFRFVNAKGNGFWVARVKGREKAFYDASWGTANAAKTGAYDWYNEQWKKELKTNPRDKVKDLIEWLGEQGETVEVKKAVDKVHEIFLPGGRTWSI